MTEAEAIDEAYYDTVKTMFGIYVTGVVAAEESLDELQKTDARFVRGIKILREAKARAKAMLSEGVKP